MKTKPSTPPAETPQAETPQAEIFRAETLQAETFQAETLQAGSNPSNSLIVSGVWDSRAADDLPDWVTASPCAQQNG